MFGYVDKKYSSISWHEYFMKIAKVTAEKSKDLSTKCGAVIVTKDNEIVSTGFNGFPRGVYDKPEFNFCEYPEIERRVERPLKYKYTEHAERNAIYNAALEGNATKEAIMYCPWYACVDCARGIIQAGISEVVGHRQIIDKTPERWQQTIVDALGLLHEAGVKCWLFDGKIDLNNELKIRFNGEEWTP